MTEINRRQLIAGGAGLGALLCMPSIARAQAQPFRIGVVSPSLSGQAAIQASVNRYIGDAVRQGVLLAEGPVSEVAAAEGIQLVVGMANAPTADAAARAGERFVWAGIDALIGGVGEGQDEALSAIAEDAGVPFLNVSSASRELRQACRQFTFHVSPSAAMYLDAMAIWGAEQGYRNWFVIHESNPAGESMMQRAAEAIRRHGAEGDEIGAASAARGEAFYGQQISAAESAGADVILLLLDYIDQVAFLGNQESLRGDIPVLPFPEPTTQTRTYINSFAAVDMQTSPDFRIGMWDASIADGAAGAFNDRYLSRWGTVADPQAWASYAAVQILFDAVRGAGAIDGATLADYLGNSNAVFDVLKGPGTSFRPWDHQLRQPVYIVRVNHDNDWVQTIPNTFIGAASVERELPLSTVGDGDPIARLDALGDGADDADCQL